MRWSADCALAVGHSNSKAQENRAPPAKARQGPTARVALRQSKQTPKLCTGGGSRASGRAATVQDEGRAREGGSERDEDDLERTRRLPEYSTRLATSDRQPQGWRFSVPGRDKPNREIGMAFAARVGYHACASADAAETS